MKFPFKTVALIGKYKTPEIADPLLRLATFLSGKGVSVVVDKLSAQHLGRHGYREMALNEMGDEVDLAIVLGGDGTMLNIARTLAPLGVPLVGVNQGRLGFLTDISLDTMQQTIAAMLQGDYVTEQRMLLSTRIERDGVEVFHGQALNEMVVHRGNAGSMIEIEARIDGEYLYNQRSDGLIVATPTGSTAYAMSAGGPILHPGLDLIVLVPVCPHALSNRPIVVKSDALLEILLHRSNSGGVCVRLDSHSTFELRDGDKLEVTRFPLAVCLLHPPGHSYYRTLREKLLWNTTL